MAHLKSLLIGAFLLAIAPLKPQVIKGITIQLFKLVKPFLATVEKARQPQFIWQRQRR